MIFDEFQMYCLSKPGVTEDYPFKGEAVWLKVMGKMFAMANVRELKMFDSMVPPFHFINLKCEPNYSLELRAEYAAIIPAWHQSKTHWNSLIMDGSLKDKLVKSLIDHSYERVVSALTKKQKEELSTIT